MPIVTVTGAEQSVGGPALMVPEIFNGVWDASISKTEAARDAVNAAIREARVVPRMAQVGVDSPYRLPARPTVDQFDASEGRNLYETIRQTLEAAISDKLDTFLLTYFPSGSYYDKAISWIDRTLSTGGTGIDPAVEQQMWERGRARINEDSIRAEREAMATWADRRFPLPPGALTNQVGLIRIDAGRKMADQSREIAVKSFEAELENIRFAVQNALSARTAAISAAGDYIKTIMMGPQIASDLAMAQVNARVQIAQALTQMYATEAAAQEPLARLAISEAEIQARIGEANLRAESASQESRVRAALEFASMLGTQAAAALNALSASAQISGSTTSSI